MPMRQSPPNSWPENPDDGPEPKSSPAESEKPLRRCSPSSASAGGAGATDVAAQTALDRGEHRGHRLEARGGIAREPAIDHRAQPLRRVALPGSQRACEDGLRDRREVSALDGKGPRAFQCLVERDGEAELVGA